MAAHTLDLAHVDVLDGIAPAVDDDGAAREVLQLDLPEGGQKRLAVLDLAVDRLDRFHDPARVGVAGLPVVGGHLAHLGLERLGEFLVGGIVEGGRVVQRRVDAQRLVTHLRQHRLVGDGAVAEEGKLGLESRLRVLLHELERAAAEEDGEDGVGIPLDLGEERGEVRGVQGHPDLLHDLAALLLEGALEASHRLPAEGVVEGDHGDLLVLEVLGHPFPESVHGLAAVPARPHHPLRGLALGQVIGGHDRVRGGDLRAVREGVDGIARGGEEPAREDVDAVLVHQLARLGQRRRGHTLGVLHDELDLPPRYLPADLVQVELGAAEHVLAEGGGGAGERGQEPDLDGSALGHGRRRAREGQGQGGDEGKQAGQHDGPPMISAGGRGARPRRHAGRRG